MFDCLRTWKGLVPLPVEQVRFGALRSGLFQPMVWILSTLTPTIGAAGLRWEPGPGFRSAPVSVAAPSRPGFTRVDPQSSGLWHTNRLSPILASNNQILENGAGLAMGDVDGDGWVDVYLCGSENPNRLYRNQGDWRFADATQSAGVACAGQFSTGALFADVDGDRDLDLLVNGLGTGTRLFINDGAGHFVERMDSGLSRTSAATSMAMADVDGDGDLDLYVACYRTSTARNEPEPPRISARVVQGRVEVSPADRFFGVLRSDGKVEVVEKGEPDGLYVNRGDGRFQAVSWTGGAFLDERGQGLPSPPEDWGLSVLLRDLTGDGQVDIYVCNDFFRSRDRFWVGDGKGHFRAVDPRAWRAMPLSSMSIDAGDLNRDGVDDFLVVEMLSRGHGMRQRQRANALKVEQAVPLFDPGYVPEVLANTLQVGRGDGTFAEVGWLSGLAATDWSWNVALLDVDLDGWEDVLVATGNNHDVLDMDAQNELDRAGPQSPRPSLDYYPSLPQRSLIFRNRRELRFEEVGEQWGWQEVGIAQGLALADLDRDGDLDVIIGRLNQGVLLYRNEAAAPRIAVKLKGRAPNTEGIGARIRLHSPSLQQSQTVVAGGRYLSADDKLRSFAIPDPASASRLEILWPSGHTQVVTNLGANRSYEIEEPSRENSSATLPAGRVEGSPLFTEVSPIQPVIAHEDPIDELGLQPLSPVSLAHRGPGVSWLDWDGDGREDVLISAGRGGRSVVLTNSLGGRVPAGRFAVGWQSGIRSQGECMVIPAGTELIVSVPAAEERPPDVQVYPRVQDWAQTNRGSTLPQLGCGGILSLGDYDQDGDLDLCVGGQAVPGRFPESWPSALFRREPSGWRRDEANESMVQSLQRVVGLVSSDLDGDGDLDVVAAVEWGPIQLWRNERGRFSSWAAELDLSRARAPVPDVRWLSDLTGFWHSIVVGDFDGDGCLDLAAANEGWNFPKAALLPWHLYYGDLAGRGRMDCVEAFAEPGSSGRLVPWQSLDVLGSSFPMVRDRYPTFAQYAQAGLKEVLSQELPRAQLLVVRTSSSWVFLNRGTRFEAHELPLEAQASPARGLVVADFDGDGREDLFVSQNDFSPAPEMPRSAAGRGLLLRGKGDGEFVAWNGTESGIRLYGDQRGAATADFDGDGRADLAVAQNRGPVVLLRNNQGKPGLRVRLEGPAGNPQAWGASLRVRDRDGFAPRRELHGGSGQMSCDSPITVLASHSAPLALEVRWPDGQSKEYPLAPAATSVRIKP